LWSIRCLAIDGPARENARERRPSVIIASVDPCRAPF
jgi:hypothetical protein